MRPPLPRVALARRLRSLGLGVLVAIPAAFATCAVGIGSHDTLTWLSTWGSAIAYVAGAAICLSRAKRERRGRATAIWFGVACGCWAGANLYYAIFIAPDPIPLPSPADIGYISFPVAVGTGLVVLARSGRTRPSADVWLDALLAALGTAAVVATIIFALHGFRDSALGAIVTTLIPPLEDIALLGLLAGVWSVLGWRPERYLAVIATAVVLITAADVATFSRILGGGDVGGAFANLGWTSGIALLSLSTLTGPDRSLQPGGLSARMRLFLPVVFTGISMTILAVGIAVNLPRPATTLAFGALIVGFLRLFRAFRELRLGEERLRLSEARANREAGRLRAVLHGITGYAIIGGSPSAGIKFFSPGAEAMLGFTAAEALGRPESEVFMLPEELAAKAAELGCAPHVALIAGAGGARHATQSWTYVHRDGFQIPVVATTTLLEDAETGPEYLTVARDVSGEREADRYRAVHDALLPELAAASSAADAVARAVALIGGGLSCERVAVWMADGDELRCVEGWRADETAGAQREVIESTEAAGVRIVNQVWLDGQPRWFTGLTADPGARPRSGPHDPRTPEAQTLVAVPITGAAEGLEATGVLVLIGTLSPPGEIVLGVLGAIARALGVHLEREQAAGELRAARDEAHAANLAKSEFVSRISHELRTPLNAVLGFAQLMEREANGPVQRDRTALIIAAARHLTDMIDDLLDLARVERGEMRVSVESVAAADVLKEVLDLTQPLIEARRLTLEVDVHNGLFRYVHADYGRLRQVLLNLISNAVKYNRPGGTIRVEFETGEETLKFLISDTGPGIRDEDLPRLFRPFERLGAERGEEEGTGLGLVVSQGLVEAMGGRLGVRTEVGVGSTFFAEFPLADAPSHPGGQDRADEPAGGPRLPAATILYIEDNPINASLVASILAGEHETRLLTTTLGATGLELAREHLPDVVLLDLHLPDMEGLEVLRALRADTETGAIPVVVLSAYGTAAQRDALLDAGACAYLTKPVEVNN